MERNYFDQYQEALWEKQWTWDDIPFYEGRGTRQSIAMLHDLDYVDVYEQTYGRKMGANGIGRLREVALSRISDDENQVYREDLPYQEDMALLEGHGLGRIEDLQECRAQQERYAAVLMEQGVTVHWLDWVESPAGPFGPMQSMWAAQDLLVVRGGAIVPKMGWHPFSFGRAEWLSQWAFQWLNIPTILTIAGKGVAEAGATVWLADDVYVVGLSAAYNREGLDQLVPAVRRTSGTQDLAVLTIRCQGRLYLDGTTGASAHVTNLIAPLDHDMVLCYSAGIDTPTLLWLERNGYRRVEASFDDVVRHNVCNLTLLEPGRVIMPADARETVDRVRAAGIDVIEVPYSQITRAGGGLHRATLQIYREPGGTKP